MAANEVRRALILGLLSMLHGKGRKLRALEGTMLYTVRLSVALSSPRVLQREWRERHSRGNIEPAMEDKGLPAYAVGAWAALIGRARVDEPVPEEDFYKVLSDTPRLWVKPEDWIGDEKT